ncbi:MAG: class I SAM-dependent methyltransferase [Myxococcaceae bacterium]
MPGQSPGLLQELHLLTPDGALNADARRKLKQVNHLVGLLRPALTDVFRRFGEPQVVDAGAGNAYLSFVLYELFFQEKGQLVCVETRPDLVTRARARAARLGFSRLRFVESALESAALPERIHLLVALHACDTATDDALALALARNADHVAVVPCCQAEVAQFLKSHPPADDSLSGLLSAHPWHRREYASHLTNVARAFALEACGYRVMVTELTGWEHSLKNELILGQRVRKENPTAMVALQKLADGAGALPRFARAVLTRTLRA